MSWGGPPTAQPELGGSHWETLMGPYLGTFFQRSLEEWRMTKWEEGAVRVVIRGVESF